VRAVWEGEVRLNSLDPALVGTPVSSTNPSPSPNPEPEQELLEKHPFSRKLHAKCLRVTMELLQQTIHYRHPLYVDFFPDDVLTREFEKNLAEQATLYPCSQYYLLDHITPVGNVGEGRPGGWERGVGVGEVGSRDVVRDVLAVEYLPRYPHYVLLLLTWALAHFAHLRTLAHDRAGSALGQVAQAVRAAAGRREGRAQGPPEGDKPWRQGEGGGPLQCMSRRLETLWSP